jgi:hypothetical protein
LSIIIRKILIHKVKHCYHHIFKDEETSAESS